ncbi:MAG TPA: CinA family nicotinamide mononucleotide deamidase-related protein [Lacipirellulaceae bacterium]|nr:CinA family nicotinamide mononucleotide deamidase-related protein [Lacipirellulaceae bacterium]
MRAEVIAIGDELTSGQRLDTNSQWLSERLGEIGIPVAFHTTVGDDLENSIAVFRTAMERAEIVISTGGLGPTADDLTRDAIAAAAGVELVQDDAALAHIRNVFARRKRSMPERNVVQAQFPRGSRVVPNPDGTAPGIDLTVPQRSFTPPRSGERQRERHCRVIALPGVPAEMVTMWQQTVGPALTAALPEQRVICHRRIKSFGAGESDIEAMLPDMIRRKREPLVGITVSGATITLRITASGSNETACRRTMEPTVTQIRETLGVLVFGEEDDELENAVVHLLQSRGQSVAVAEWATDGLVTQWLAAADTTGKCLRGGLVAGDETTLACLLGVNATDDTISGPEAARAMARAIQQKTSADYGLGVTFYSGSGPDAASDRNIDQNGALHVALASGDNVRAKSFPLGSHPAITKILSAKRALNVLRLALLNSPI